MPTFVLTQDETSRVLHAVETHMADVMEDWKSDVDSRLARLDELVPVRHRLLNALAFPEQREGGQDDKQ